MPGVQPDATFAVTNLHDAGSRQRPDGRKSRCVITLSSANNLHCCRFQDVFVHHCFPLSLTVTRSSTTRPSLSVHS